ncbi:MAG: cytochrome P450 [Leptolyngbya sp. RL_3_1]|nr:cytochrome P450 [Leptolyngbya sp. RL_3_1]
MDTPSDVLVLSEGEAPAIAPAAPPRCPRWSDTLAYIADPDQFCRQNLARHGPIFQTRVFGGTTVFVGSSRAIQMAFNGDGDYTEIGLPPTTMAMFGEYSLFQRPDLHRQRKTALRPGFTGSMLAAYIPHMQRVIAQHLQTWERMSARDAPLPLVPSVEKVSFDVLAPLLLGIPVDQGDAALAGLPIATKTDLKRCYKTFFDGFYGLLKWRSPLTAFGRGYQARENLIEFMRAVIQRRRRAPVEAPTDFLGMMLAQQQDNPKGVFSNDLIENQCLLQLWASHYEVTGLAASWIYQVGQHPEVLQCLRAEQAAVLETSQGLNDITPATLKQLTYLDATIKETLRVLPPSSTATRRLTKSVVLDGVLYEKGWSLIAEPRIAHAMTTHFTHPDQFDPDRFLPDRNEGGPYEFIPFGGGVHACLGAQLATTLMKVLAMHLLHRFDWQCPGKAQFVQFPLKQIKNNYPIQLTIQDVHK